ncbi:HAD-IIA family hydrolase [Candidatus Bipolaricaulota bacterium]|nr:HAD-IIA family hydrolase [Candidatus Bipolaricaulota bacterium]
MKNGGGYEAVIFDLDGTLFRGKEVIAGAPEALAALAEHTACRFLSNNGERTSTDLAQRLRNFGFDVHEDDVASSADLVLKYARETARSARILALSSPELASALAAQGHMMVEDDSATLVLIGVDRTLTRERMVQGLRALLNGAALIATNEDPTYPAADGLRPAAGAYVGFFRGMGFEPERFCGKPDEKAVRMALESWGVVRPSRCLFVGDNLRTDIAAAARVGADSVLVLSGVSARSDISAIQDKPTAILESVSGVTRSYLDELASRRKTESIALDRHVRQ